MRRRQLLFNRSLSSNIITLRVLLAGTPTYASFTPTPLKHNHKLAYMFEIDDNGKHARTKILNYYLGQETDDNYLGSPITYSDNCGNNFPFRVSAAVFGRDNNGNDLITNSVSLLNWQDIKEILQNKGCIMNHQWGGSNQEKADRYLQIRRQNENVYTALKALNYEYFQNSLVVPAADPGYTISSFLQGMGLVSSQAGVEALWDGITPLAKNAYISDVANRLEDMFFARDHMFEGSSFTTNHLNDLKGYVQTAIDKSLIAPCTYRLFSHGPGSTPEFEKYRELISYMQTQAGDTIWAPGSTEFYEYMVVKELILNSIKTTQVFDANAKTLTIKLDTSTIPDRIKFRDLSLLVDTDTEISSVEVVSGDVDSMSNNTSLINLFKEKTVFIDPALYPVHPRIVAAEIESGYENLIKLTYDRPVTQIGAGFTVTDKTVISVDQEVGGDGTIWYILLSEVVYVGETIKFSYQAEVGDATDATAENIKVCSYVNYQAVNNSSEVYPEDPEQDISVKIVMNEAEYQVFTCDTVADLRTYLSTYSFNKDTIVYFNTSAIYTVESRWLLNYTNGDYFFTLKNKVGFTPTLSGDGVISDIIRNSMSKTVIDGLIFESHKYTVDSIGDNYSGAIISQTIETNNNTYQNLTLQYGMKGLRIAGPNASTVPNIHSVFIDNIICSNLIGESLQIGIEDVNSIAIDSRVDSSYGMYDITVGEILTTDTVDGADIETSGAKFNGQIVFVGVRDLHINGPITSDKCGRQALVTTACKFGSRIKRLSLTNYSLREPSGFKQGLAINSCIDVSLENCFIKSPTFQSARITTGRNISSYYCTFAGIGEGVVFQNVRNVSELNGNLFLGGSNNYALSVSFDRGDSYIPELATDYIVEEQNTFYCASGDFRLISVSGIGSGNTNFVVNNAYNNLFSDYRTNYNRGLTSQGGDASSLVWDVDEKHLGTTLGRNFVATAVSDITTDIDNLTRVLPTDCGAYDKDAV